MGICGQGIPITRLIAQYGSTVWIQQSINNNTLYLFVDPTTSDVEMSFQRTSFTITPLSSSPTETRCTLSCTPFNTIPPPPTPSLPEEEAPHPLTQYLVSNSNLLQISPSSINGTWYFCNPEADHSIYGIFHIVGTAKGYITGTNEVTVEIVDANAPLSVYQEFKLLSSSAS